MEYKEGEFGQFGNYLLEVLNKKKNSTVVKVIGVRRYPSQGLSKDYNGRPNIVSQKPLKFEEVKEVPNQYLKDIDTKEFNNLGSEKFYNYTIHVSIFIAQQTILKQINERMAYKLPSDWNLEQILKVLEAHGKDFGLV